MASQHSKWVCNPVKGGEVPHGCSVYNPKTAGSLGSKPHLFSSLNSCLLSNCPGAVVPHGYSCDTSLDYCRATDSPGPSLATCDHACPTPVNPAAGTDGTLASCEHLCNQIMCTTSHTKNTPECPQFCATICSWQSE